MKLSNAEKAAVLVTVLFVILLAGYKLGKGSADTQFTVATQKSPKEGTLLVGGDKKALEAADEGDSRLPSLQDDVVVNINTADLQELCVLNGVGEVIAGRIIEYRNINGTFKDIKDIMEVQGIGEGIFAKIQDHITI